MTKRKGSKSEATKAGLLAAALKVIGAKGYNGATIDAIAEEAGVSKGVVYYYFDTKADIATEVLISSFEGLVCSFEAIVEDCRNTHDALERIVMEFARRIYANREASRFILSEIWRSERAWSGKMRELEERLAILIEGLLTQAMENGTIRKEVDLRFIAVATVGVVLTSAQYYLMVDDSADQESFARHCIDFIQHSLTAGNN